MSTDVIPFPLFKAHGPMAEGTQRRLDPWRGACPMFCVCLSCRMFFLLCPSRAIHHCDQTIDSTGRFHAATKIMNLQNKIALVTGGTRGIGAATALALSRDGANIAISARREDAEALATRDAVRKLGRR